MPLENTKLSFSSDFIKAKSYLSKKIMPSIKKIGATASKISTVAGKVATVASIL